MDTAPSLATEGTDLGHNACGLWIIRFAGQISREQELVDFAEANAKSVLERAYVESCVCWAQGLFGRRAPNIESHQLAATLARSDASYAEHLPRTYDYWFRYFVNPHYEVWNGVDGSTNAPIRDLPKLWQWKRAYHAFEHALVGVIAAQQLQGLPVLERTNSRGEGPTGECRPPRPAGSPDALRLWEFPPAACRP